MPGGAVTSFGFRGVVTASAVALVVFVAYVGISESRIDHRAAREELVQFADKLRLGGSGDDVSRAFSSGSYKHLELIAIDDETWLVRTPFRFGARNWVLWLEFSNSALNGCGSEHWTANPSFRMVHRLTASGSVRGLARPSSSPTGDRLVFDTWWALTPKVGVTYRDAFIGAAAAWVVAGILVVWPSTAIHSLAEFGSTKAVGTVFPLPL